MCYTQESRNVLVMGCYISFNFCNLPTTCISFFVSFLRKVIPISLNDIFNAFITSNLLLIFIIYVINNNDHTELSTRIRVNRQKNEFVIFLRFHRLKCFHKICENFDYLNYIIFESDFSMVLGGYNLRLVHFSV